MKHYCKALLVVHTRPMSMFTCSRQSLQLLPGEVHSEHVLHFRTVNHALAYLCAACAHQQCPPNSHVYTQCKSSLLSSSDSTKCCIWRYDIAPAQQTKCSSHWWSATAQARGDTVAPGPCSEPHHTATCKARNNKKPMSAASLVGCAVLLASRSCVHPTCSSLHS
jgi:hypothetical protein